MQSKGEESKSSPKISQIQAKSTEVWETELSCGAWVVLKCVAVHLNSLPQRLKKCTVFSHFCTLSPLNCFQSDLLRALFSQVCSYSFTCWFFLPVGLGSGGSAPWDVRGWVEPHREAGPVATSAPALAQPWMAELTPPLCPHTNTDIQAGKALPKSAGISLGGSNVGWLLMEGLWGSRCGGSTAAALPKQLWAWRFLLMRNRNVDAYDFPVLSKREAVAVTFRY